MIFDILVFITCTFNVYSLLFVMSNTEKVTDILGHMNNKAKIFSVLAIIATTECIVRLGVYLIYFLIFEYFCVLTWYGVKKKSHLQAGIRGIISIILMIVVELTIIYLYYHKDIENIQRTGRINHEIQIACYLGMAMIQYLVFIGREILRISSRFRKGLVFTLELKAVTDIVWLYICIASAEFKNSHVMIPFLFIAEILINYCALLIMVLKIDEHTVREKRADINVNTYEYYLNMEEEHRQIRKMYHEMKNQLMIMEEKGEKTELNHEKAMQKKLDELNKFYHTGIPSLDILLFDGKTKSEARNINFEAVISEGCLSFMDETDVNVIFSNAIINAIEACEKITDGPKEIKIKAGKNAEDTLIYFKNTACQERKKGSLSTNKKNKKLHGIGLTSIQECAEKYHGYVSIIEEDSTFQLAILFGKE